MSTTHNITGIVKPSGTSGIGEPSGVSHRVTTTTRRLTPLGSPINAARLANQRRSARQSTPLGSPINAARLAS
jgi:hypothetical protein